MSAVPAKAAWVANVVGTVMAQLSPLTRGQYNTFRGWRLPDDENGADEGYMITLRSGHVSWQPKAEAERNFRPVEAMDFGAALAMLKMGHKVARKGWNGKGMWIALSGVDGPRSVAAGTFWSQPNADYAYQQPGHCATVLPCLTMKTADGTILMGWLASQSDMLAEDWSIAP